MNVVLFACVRNAGRSQMAAAFFNALADPARARALSAGTRPAEHVDPTVVTAMRELGLDLSGARPRALAETLGPEVALLVTLGCGEACPVAPGLRRLDWALADPAGQPLEVVRPIRDEVHGRVRTLVHENGWARAGTAPCPC